MRSLQHTAPMGAHPKVAKVALVAVTLALMQCALAAPAASRPSKAAHVEAAASAVKCAAAVGAAPPAAVGKPEAAAAATAAGELAPPPPAKRARRMPPDAELAGLEAVLQYNFTSKWLLREALIHPSFGEWNNAR